MRTWAYPPFNVSKVYVCFIGDSDQKNSITHGGIIFGWFVKFYTNGYEKSFPRIPDRDIGTFSLTPPINSSFSLSGGATITERSWSPSQCMAIEKPQVYKRWKRERSIGQDTLKNRIRPESSPKIKITLETPVSQNNSRNFQELLFFLPYRT
jgi:hypothetical protein